MDDFTRRLSTAIACCYTLVLVQLLIALPARAAVVLQYHHISDQTPRATSTSPARFISHLNYIEEHGYAVVPLTELVASLRRGKPLPDKAVAITFDDGYLSVYEEAYPELKARGWPFTVFVNTYALDAGLSPFVNWKQLREMVANGASVANHTDTHAHLLRYFPSENYAAWRERIISEVMTAQLRITAEIGSQFKALAYPYGEYNLQVQELLKEMNYIAFGQHSGPLSSSSDLLALPRFPFGGAYGGDNDFTLKVNSLHLPLVAGKNAVIKRTERGKPFDDVILPKKVRRPVLQLHLQSEALAKQVRCYASGQGETDIRVDGVFVQAQAKQDLPVGRSRYNCTAASSQEGRFYWHSQLWLRKKPNGDWHEEAQPMPRRR